MANKQTSTRRARWLKGLRAEQYAAFWLQLKGYHIAQRRYKSPFGEIDLIVQRGNMLAFVEVKARANITKGKEAITPRQRRRIEKAAVLYMSKRQHQGYQLRFDAVLVAGLRLHHLKAAWRMGD